MTHSAKFCMERPRKVGAKYSGRDFQNDEAISDVKLDYEGKRDRWNGYNPDQYKQVIDEWNLLEKERKARKERDLEEKMRKKTERRLRGLPDDEDSDDGKNSMSSSEDSDKEDAEKAAD